MSPASRPYPGGLRRRRQAVLYAGIQKALAIFKIRAVYFLSGRLDKYFLFNVLEKESRLLYNDFML